MLKTSDYLGFSWVELWYEEFEIDAALDAIRRLINTQEKSLEELKEKFKKVLEADPAYNSLNLEDRGDYYFQFFEREDQTIEEIKRIQRSSLLMAIFAFFEGRLKSICQKIEDDNKLPIKLSEVKGNTDIQKLWTYLIDVYKIDITKVKPYYELINQQKFARNRIVHHEGYLSKDQKVRLNLVLGLGVKDYLTDSKIEITDISFLKYLLDQIDGFFKELLLVIDKRYKEMKKMASTNLK
jgi:hypothetical protein